MGVRLEDDLPPQPISRKEAIAALVTVGAIVGGGLWLVSNEDATPLPATTTSTSSTTVFKMRVMVDGKEKICEVRDVEDEDGILFESTCEDVPAP